MIRTIKGVRHLSYVGDRFYRIGKSLNAVFLGSVSLEPIVCEWGHMGFKKVLFVKLLYSPSKAVLLCFLFLSARCSPLLDISPLQSYCFLHPVTAGPLKQVDPPSSQRAPHTTFARRDLYFRTRVLQRYSVLWHKWPAHCIFKLLTFIAIPSFVTIWRVRPNRPRNSLACSIH